MALYASMTRQLVIDTIESLKQMSEYYLQHEMKNCYIDTLQSIEKAEYIRDNFFVEFDKIQAVDFYTLSPEGEKEVADKKSREEEAERLRQEEQRKASYEAHLRARTQARSELEKKYMNALSSRMILNGMKDSDLIRSMKNMNVPICSEEELRIQKRMEELLPVFSK